MMTNTTINNLEFAQNQLLLSDSFAAYHLKRLTETLSNQAENDEKSSIYFKLTGHSKLLRYPSLQLHISAKLPVICQRCLDEMSIALDLNFTYIISPNVIEEVEENDEVDWLEVNNEMDVLVLIEDELLLAMPISPMHSHNCAKLSAQSGDKPNPFAVLKNLKSVKR